MCTLPGVMVKRVIILRGTLADEVDSPKSFIFLPRKYTVNCNRVFITIYVTKSPYMEMDCQFISVYGKFMTSQTAYFSRADKSKNVCSVN